MQAGKTKWQFILTGNGSWFFHEALKSRIWLLPVAETPEAAWQLINPRKSW
jgi:hypothetical protein